jgi:integrase
MNTTVKVILWERPLKDNSHPLYIRITHLRIKTFIQLNVSIMFNDWDAGLQTVKNSCKLYDDIRHLNAYIQKKKTEVNTFINDLYDSGNIEGMTAKDIKNAFLLKSDNFSFQDYTNKLIKEMESSGRYGNAMSYKQALSFVIRNNDKQDIQFRNLNYSFLLKLESAHLAAGNTRNSLAVYFRAIRAIYNRAIKTGIAKPEWYPFKNYSIKTMKTPKRAISKTDIMKIEAFNPPDGSPLFHARNYFMFSFYMVGLNFSDMAMLKLSNIVRNRIEFNRQKTGKFYSLELYDKPKAIVDLYTKSKSKTDYIFPIVSRQEPILIRKDIKNQLKLYNNTLKLLAKELEIGGNLTSYVTRHSWASIGKALNVPVTVISEALGHENLRTTQIYLDSLDKDVIDTASRLITG